MFHVNIMCVSRPCSLVWEFHWDHNSIISYDIEQFRSLFIGKDFGIENSYIDLHASVKFIAFKHSYQ